MTGFHFEDFFLIFDKLEVAVAIELETGRGLSTVNRLVQAFDHERLAFDILNIGRKRIFPILCPNY